MSFKRLFARSLGADPARLHFAAHSHHLWPDASFDGQMEAWLDAARLADRKWDRVMGEVWPEAQGHVARELGTAMPDAVVFSSNTHDFLVRLVSACPRRGSPLRILTSDNEFHSARRQFARWEEDGTVAVEHVASAPFDDFPHRFAARAQSGEHDLIFLSQVQFSTGLVVDDIARLAAFGRPDGPWVVIDGYHSFMALETPFAGPIGSTAFYLGGTYKYAMAGEGACFLHAPPGFGPRPPITGWFAEFEDLTLPPGAIGYAPDARRFLGATFDPSGLYRFNAVRRMLEGEGMTTAEISAHCRQLQVQFLAGILALGLGEAEVLNPVDDKGRARFIALRDPRAQQWEAALKAANVITDVRGDVLRIGFAIYQDASDVEALLRRVAELR